jgi:hypothetical protein
MFDLFYALLSELVEGEKMGALIPCLLYWLCMGKELVSFSSITVMIPSPLTHMCLNIQTRAPYNHFTESKPNTRPMVIQQIKEMLPPQLDNVIATHYQAICNLFAWLDRDADGTITSKDLCLLHKTSEQEVEKMIQELNADGKASICDLMNALNKHTEPE